MKTSYRVREKRFSTPLDLCLCITSDSYKSKQKTGFGEKEQKNQQTFIYIKKKAKPEIPYNSAENKANPQTSKQLYH